MGEKTKPNQEAETKQSRLKRVATKAGKTTGAVVATAAFLGAGAGIAKGAVDGAKMVGDRAAAERQLDGDNTPVFSTYETPARAESVARDEYIRNMEPETRALFDYYSSEARNTELQDVMNATAARLADSYAAEPIVGEVDGEYQTVRYPSLGSSDVISVRMHGDDVVSINAESADGGRLSLGPRSVAFSYNDHSDSGVVEFGVPRSNSESFGQTVEGELFRAPDFYTEGIGGQSSSMEGLGGNNWVVYGTEDNYASNPAEARAVDDRGMETLASITSAVVSTPEASDGF